MKSFPAEDPAVPSRVALLFTRFPVATETFLQREVEVLRSGFGPFEVCALWPFGAMRSSPRPDDQMQVMELAALLWWIPYWLYRCPRGMRTIAESILQARAPNAVNFLENLLGLGFAILRARKMALRYRHLHAVWASAPAAAAWAVHQLTGIPYSMAGHAYDLYENGGDGWLPLKMRSASLIRTSTGDGQRRWIQLGADPRSIRLIRRGLPELPLFEAERQARKPLRILAVGRMVEKMGHFLLLDILSRLQGEGFPFEATVVGGGPLFPKVRDRCRDLGLEDRVYLAGALPFENVEPYFRDADCFLFTGRVARSGDRAGFPNAIGEAMAWGVPVVATPVGAVREGIEDGRTGFLFRTPSEAAERIRLLAEAAGLYQEIRHKARAWAEEYFDARRNMSVLVREIIKAHPKSRS